MIRDSIHTHRRILLLNLAGLLSVILLVLMACTPQAGNAPAGEAPVATEAPAAAEPATEAVTETVTEAVSEPATEAVTETVTEAVTETVPVTSTEVEASTEVGPDPVAADLAVLRVELPDAEAQEPSGRVLAPAGVNIRTGPGTNYPIVGVAAQGAEGAIVGVSEDGQWWVARVPFAPNGQGWVAAAYVEATNAENVPVVPTLPLPDASGAAVAAPVTAAAPAATPVPVPDELNPGSLILFSASRVLREGNRAYDLEDIYSVPAQPGSTAQLIIQNAMQPSLQRNGKILAFRSTQSDQLGLSAYDFGIDARVRYSNFLEDSTPRWNPAGDQLVFSSNRTGDRRWRVYTTPATASDDRSGFPNAANLEFGKDADWHPSQARLVFKGCDSSGNACGLWTMNADGSERGPLTDSANDSLPRWSPDGASVAFMSDSRDGNWELYVLSAADGAVTRLTDDAANDGHPAWSPDGSQIAFMSNRGGPWGIWIMPASGGEAQLITQLDQELPDWLLQGLDWPR